MEADSATGSRSVPGGPPRWQRRLRLAVRALVVVVAFAAGVAFGSAFLGGGGIEAGSAPPARRTPGPTAGAEAQPGVQLIPVRPGGSSGSPEGRAAPVQTARRADGGRANSHSRSRRSRRHRRPAPPSATVTTDRDETATEAPGPGAASSPEGEGPHDEGTPTPPDDAGPDGN